MSKLTTTRTTRWPKTQLIWYSNKQPLVVVPRLLKSALRASADLLSGSAPRIRIRSPIISLKLKNQRRTTTICRLNHWDQYCKHCLVTVFTSANLASFTFNCVLFKQFLHNKNWRLQRSRRRVRWPLDHHHQGSFPEEQIHLGCQIKMFSFILKPSAAPSCK